MSRLRLKFKLNQGREGIPLDKFAEIAQEADKFLRMLAHDVKIDIPKGDLIAGQFKNGSVLFDVEYAGTSSDVEVQRYARGFEYVSAFPAQLKNKKTRSIQDLINVSTLAQYAKIGKVMDPDEKLGMAVYRNRGVQDKDWRYLSTRRSAEIYEALAATVEYSGSLQGAIFAFHKESRPPYFTIKELSSGTLVNCLFAPHQYKSIVEVLRDRDAIVHVNGLVKASRIDRKPVRMQVEYIEPAEKLTDEDIEHFFGCAPNLTGSLSTAEFISQIRDRDN